MSRAGVGMVIEKLLTEESLRVRFAVDRIETMAELCVRGCDLTHNEIDLFYRTDVRLWFLADGVRSGAAAVSAATLLRCVGGKQRDTVTSLCIDSCAAQEAVVSQLGRGTRSSSFTATKAMCWSAAEGFFSNFSPVVFLGSIADDGSGDNGTIGRPPHEVPVW